MAAMEGGVSDRSGGQFKLAADAAVWSHWGEAGPGTCREAPLVSGTKRNPPFWSLRKPDLAKTVNIPCTNPRREIARRAPFRLFERGASNVISFALLLPRVRCSFSKPRLQLHPFQQPSGGLFATVFSPVSNCRPARRRD